MTIRSLATALLAAALAAHAQADSASSHCGYSDSESQQPASFQACTFSQRQGHIGISVQGEPVHRFDPDGDAPGTFLDQDGQRVYRKRGLGDRGQLFQLVDRYLYVLWDPAQQHLECPQQDLAAAGQCELGDGNVGFRLHSEGAGSLSTLTIAPVGLAVDNSPQEIELDGTAYLAELADLDANGWPEVYVYVRSAGSGSHGSLAAYAVNNGKSATPIYLPPLEQEPGAAEGYMGHDEFRVVESRLVRRFPVYAEGDTNASPSGGTRQLQYRLEAGEAGWVLVVDKVVEY